MGKPGDKSKQKTKPGDKGGLQIKVDAEAKDNWLRRVGGGRASDLLGRHPFRNTLPEPPMDPKLLQQSSEVLMKQMKYKTTTIEGKYKYPILTEPDLGVTVNLIDPHAYRFYEEGTGPELHATDDKLANFHVDAPGTKKGKARPRPRVAWLRKTEYMANDLYEPAQKFKSQLDTMATIRETAKRKDSEAGKTVDERLDDIEASFEKAKVAPVHPSKKHLKVAKVVPLVPDLDMWDNQYTMVNFDDDAYSATGHTKDEARFAIMKAYRQAIEESVAPQQFVGYMLPKKRKHDDITPEEEAIPGAGEYNWVRNYSFQHEGDPSEKNIILDAPRDGNVFKYVLLRSKLAIHRVKQFQNQFMPSRVDVERRSLRSFERNARGRRKRDEIQLEFDTEPDSEPEAPVIPEATEAAEGEEGAGKEEDDAAISGDEKADEGDKPEGEGDTPVEEDGNADEGNADATE